MDGSANKKMQKDLVANKGVCLIRPYIYISTCTIDKPIDKPTSTFNKKLTNYQNMLYFIYNLA